MGLTAACVLKSHGKALQSWLKISRGKALTAGQRHLKASWKYIHLTAGRKYTRAFRNARIQELANIHPILYREPGLRVAAAVIDERVFENAQLPHVLEENAGHPSLL